MGRLVTLFESIADEWRKRGVPLMPPAAEAEIVALFAELGCPLSADIRDLYATVGGFVDYESDGQWSFWSLGRMRKEAGGRHRPFVMFADWLILSHVYCFRFETPDVSSVYISHDGSSLEARPVASSVAEFFEKLLSDADSVDAWRTDA